MISEWKWLYDILLAKEKSKRKKNVFEYCEKDNRREWEKALVIVHGLLACSPSKP
jgi:hypothetical protein